MTCLTSQSWVFWLSIHIPCCILSYAFSQVSVLCSFPSRGKKWTSCWTTKGLQRGQPSQVNRLMPCSLCHAASHCLSLLRTSQYIKYHCPVCFPFALPWHSRTSWSFRVSGRGRRFSLQSSPWHSIVGDLRVPSSGEREVFCQFSPFRNVVFFI